MNPKALTDGQLKDIFAGESWKTSPRRHQLVTLAWAANKSRCMWWHDIGTGKTLTALYMLEQWGCTRPLVVCPKSVMDVWAEQVPEHTDRDCVLLQGTAEERWLRATQIPISGPSAVPTIFIINYTGLLYMFRSEDESSGGVPYVDNKLIDKAGFDSLIVDECHHIKSHEAITNDIVYRLSVAASHAIFMTGSPVSTSEMDLFAEYAALLHENSPLGQDFFGFRRRYFDAIQHTTRRGKRWTEWSITDESKQAIREAVAPVTLRYSRDECLDLPERTDQVRYVEMSAEQRRLTGDIVAGLASEVDGGVLSPQLALNKYHKLSQVAGGFLIDDSGGVVHLRDNPKLDELMDVFSEVADKCIVFHTYVEEGRMISKALKRVGIAHAEVRGEVDSIAGLKRFKEDPKCRVLVAHPKSGGEGLNLQCASVVIFYCNGWEGPTVREQAIGRVWRMGQERPVLVVDIVTRDSVDEIKLMTLQGRQAMADELLDYVQNWKG